jgi:hypothetical protein
MKFMGDYAVSTVLYGSFTTYRPSTGAAYALAGTPILSVYKNDSATQWTTVISVANGTLSNPDSVAGFNVWKIDTSADGTFFATGNTFHVVITTGTVDGVDVAGSVVATFTIGLGQSTALRPTTAGRTLDVSATGEAGLDWANVGAPTTTLALTNTTIGVVTTTTTATNLTNEVGKYQHGAVWIDTVNGAAGTTSYTNGIATNPSSSIASAKTIADNLKLKRFWIQSGSSVTLAAAYVGYVFTGAGYILALGGQDISKSIIENVETLSGTGICTTGEAIIRNCHLGPTAITIGEVDFHDCHLMGTVTMSQATVPYLFNKCTGVSAPKITFAAANQTAVISKWSGPLTIAGMVSTNTLYLDGDGDVTFDNTNNTGVVYISGAIRLTNSGVTMNITDTSRWGEDQTIAVASAVTGLNFTVAGVVDANVQRINDVVITGDGQVGSEFGV